MNPPLQLGLVIPASGAGAEPSYHPTGPVTFSRNMHGAGDDLRCVGDDMGVMAVLVEALKKKGARADELYVLYRDSKGVQHGVVAFRGEGSELIERLLERKKNTLAGRHVAPLNGGKNVVNGAAGFGDEGIHTPPL